MQRSTPVLSGVLREVTPDVFSARTPTPEAMIADAQVCHVHVILPDHTPISAAHVVEDLYRTANEVLQTACYEVHVHRLADAPGGDPMFWSGRLAIFLGGIRSPWMVQGADRRRVFQIMRLCGEKILVGGAVFLLSGADIAQDAALAVHPNFHAAAVEHGLMQVEEGQLCDDKIKSAISVLAALKLMISHVGGDHGEYAAAMLADYLGMTQSLEKSRSRYSAFVRRRAGGDSFISATLDQMEDSLEQPVSIANLALSQNISARQLQRRFMRLVGQSPLAVYRALRVERAHQLLVQTTLPVAEVAIVTGFGTLSHLARCFREVHGVAPSELRKSAFRMGQLAQLSNAQAA